MTAGPVAQPYIPKSKGHLLWVCGTRRFGLGPLIKQPLKNKDLHSIFGPVLGPLGYVFTVFQVAQPLRNFRDMGHPAIREGQPGQKWPLNRRDFRPWLALEIARGLHQAEKELIF
jgi:hypothetical protein